MNTTHLESPLLNIPSHHPGICPTVATLTTSSLKAMISLARALHGLSRHPGYLRVALPQSPPLTATDGGNDGVPMGYDFHITPTGPQLIEVNTNAGGLLLSHQAQYPACWPDLNAPPSTTLCRQWAVSPLAMAFRRECALALPGETLRQVVILDESPTGQFLYPEMVAYRQMFRAMGLAAEIVPPEGLTMGENGIFLDGKAVQLVYNRHCDFYLEQPGLAGLRAAWVAGRVCLTPNPRVYGLLADKRRMVLWRQEQTLRQAGVAEHTIQLLEKLVPTCHMLHQQPAEEVWQGRKQWVFKPVTSFGSRGVVLGERMSRVRFQSLPPTLTLMQTLVPPEVVAAEGQETLKCDWRLFTYQNKILTVAARLYKGQVTNLRTPGHGFAPVRIL